jgi:hypothetical protein
MPYRGLVLEVEKEDLKQMKVDVAVLALTIGSLTIIGTLLSAVKWYVASMILMVGVIAYTLALIFLIGEITDKQIVKLKKHRKWLEPLVRATFVLLMGFMLFAIIQNALSLKTVIDGVSNQQKLIGLLGVLGLALSVMCWNALQSFVKKNLKKSKYFFLVLPIAALFIVGQAQITGAASLNETAQTFDALSAIVNAVQDVAGFIGEQQSFITETLGLSGFQSTILMGIVFLIAVMLAAKFIESIIKWLILILIGIFIIMLI